MCRLSVLSSNEPITDGQFYLFGLLMHFSSRGENRHGTGMIAVGEGANQYCRSGDASNNFVFAEGGMAWWEKQKEREIKTLVGHTRLASPTFRNKQPKNEPFPVEHAHPFDLGNGAFLMHNGFFGAYVRVGQERGLPAEWTDTMVFADILKETSKNGAEVSYKTIEEALIKMGEGEYALLITSGSGEVFAVRGSRNLFYVKTNFGLFINTVDQNLNDTFWIADGGLAMMGYDWVWPEEKPAMLKQWTIHRVVDGEFVDYVDIEKTVKEVAEPPKFRAASKPYNQGSFEAYGATTFPLKALAKQTQLINRMTSLIPASITYQEVEEMIATLVGVSKPCLWWDYTEEELDMAAEMLEWAFTEWPEAKPTADKEILWLEFATGYADMQTAYLAAAAVNPDFVFPYFLNSMDEIKTACSL